MQSTKKVPALCPTKIGNPMLDSTNSPHSSPSYPKATALNKSSTRRTSLNYTNKSRSSKTAFRTCPRRCLMNSFKWNKTPTATLSSTSQSKTHSSPKQLNSQSNKTLPQLSSRACWTQLVRTSSEWGRLMRVFRVLVLPWRLFKRKLSQMTRNLAKFTKVWLRCRLPINRAFLNSKLS